MLTIVRKKTNPKIKVSVTRGSSIISKLFPMNQMEEARKFNQELREKTPKKLFAHRIRQKSSLTVSKTINGVQAIMVNGCWLIKTEDGRCDPLDFCAYYEQCLAEACKRNWGGWRAIKKTGIGFDCGPVIREVVLNGWTQNGE